MGYSVGLPDFQKNRALKALENTLEKCACHAVPAGIRRHCEVENLAFVRRQCTRNQKPDYLVPLHRHPEILLQVVAGVPVCCTWTGLLNCGHGLQIACFAAPDYCHIVIMHTLLPLLFFFAQPFWETKAPEAWSIAEIDAIRTASPWAQRTEEAPVVVIYLATAAPVEHAEAELRLRLKKNPSPMPEPDPDYVEFLNTHREDTFVLAINYPTLAGLGDARESKRMEEESVMLIGKKSYGILGHFPPTPSDPVLRLIFPRAVKPSDKTVVFRLYLGGLKFPEREVEFRVKDLTYQGKLEM